MNLPNPQNMTKIQLNERRVKIIEGLMEDPVQRRAELKKIERRENRPLPPQKMSKFEAEKCEISYKWMEKFEEMHQGRMELLETIRNLETDGVQKKERIAGLKFELENVNAIVGDLKSLVKDQRQIIDGVYSSASKHKRIIFRQNLIIKKQRQELAKLHICNLRYKRLMRKFKRDSNVVSKVESKFEVESYVVPKVELKQEIEVKREVEFDMYVFAFESKKNSQILIAFIVLTVSTKNQNTQKKTCEKHWKRFWVDYRLVRQVLSSVSPRKLCAKQN